MRPTATMLRSFLVAAIWLPAACMAIAASPAGAAFPGKNGLVAFTGDADGDLDGEIYTMRHDGDDVTNLTMSPESDEADPAFSPNGNRIAFVSDVEGGTDIFVMRADGTRVRRLTEEGRDSTPSWSPNGKRIVFASDRLGGILNFDIFTMRADGTRQRRLTSNDALDSSPSWSPDGKRIALTRFHAETDGSVEVVTMMADGARTRPLTRGRTDSGSAPNWSPDGRRIAFTGSRGNGSEIFTIGADRSRVTRLTRTDAANVNPAFSPNGERIVFTSERESTPAGPDDIYTMAVDGSGQRQRTSGPSNDADPDWQPR